MPEARLARTREAYEPDPQPMQAIESTARRLYELFVTSGDSGYVLSLDRHTHQYSELLIHGETDL